MLQNTLPFSQHVGVVFTDQVPVGLHRILQSSKTYRSHIPVPPKALPPGHEF